MKKIRIIALHLAYGGVEKAVCNLANVLVERYHVEIICMYHMPDSPAYSLSPDVKVTYLMDEIPNKKEFMECVKQKKIFGILKEGCKSLNILRKKRYFMKKTAKEIQDGIVITTRNEDTVLFDRYHNDHVYVIAQLHHDHNFNQHLIRDFKEHYQHIDVFALLSDQLCEEVKGFMKGVNTHTSCITVPNFIEDLPETETFPIKEKVILAVGRLHQVKGFDRLIRMAKQICEGSEWTIQIIGDGEEFDRLNAMIIQEHASSYVKLLGKKDSVEVEKFMKQSSIFVMTSYGEGSPFVLLEAMKAKLPSIAFDVRVGPRAIIEHNHDGMLIEDCDESAFIKACHRLMKEDELRCRMGEQAYCNVRRFTKTTVAKLWYDTVEKGMNL